jgi:septum site-determining protein MinC
MSTPDEQPQQPNPELGSGVDGDAAQARLAALLDNVTVMETRPAGGPSNGEPAGETAQSEPAQGEAGRVPADAGLPNGAGHADPRTAPAETGPDSPPVGPAQLSAVKIRGRPGGVAVELGEGEWQDLLKLLEERLVAAEGFFRGGRVVLEAGPRPLVEDQLRQVRRMLEAHEMRLGVVRSTAERTLQAALEVGLSTSAEDLDAVHGPEVRASASDMARPAHFVHGRLRGVAYAGVDGNRKAVVAALEFAPTQLRIANLTAIAPEPKKTRGLRFWQKEAPRRAEIARIAEGRIVVEPWDDSKPAGLTALRR